MMKKQKMVFILTEATNDDNKFLTCGQDNPKCSSSCAFIAWFLLDMEKITALGIPVSRMAFLWEQLTARSRHSRDVRPPSWKPVHKPSANT